VLAPLPTTALLTAQSNSGKGVLLSNLFLNPRLYRGCFDRIFVFSHSMYTDWNWKELMKYSEEVMHVNPQREKTFFDTMDEKELAKIIDRQTRLADTAKKRIAAGGMKNQLPAIAVVLDDFVDDARFAKNSTLITMLASRSRHLNISLFASCQKFRAVQNTLRMAARTIYVWKLRSNADYMALEDEVTGAVSREQFRQIYLRAVNDRPFSFLTIRLDAKDPRDMFFIRFDERLTLGHEPDEDAEPAPPAPGRPASSHETPLGTGE